MCTPESQPAASKPRRRFQYNLRTLLLLPVVVALAGMVIAFIEGVLGYHRSGVAPTLNDLPEIGSLLTGCEVDDSVAYWFSRHPHGTYNYLLCGHASERQINSLCERLRLSNHALAPEAADERDGLNTEIRKAAQAAGSESYWKGPFQIGDVILVQDKGQSIGGYRRSDGWFSLRLMFHSWESVNGQQEQIR